MVLSAVFNANRKVTSYPAILPEDHLMSPVIRESFVCGSFDNPIRILMAGMRIIHTYASTPRDVEACVAVPIFERVVAEAIFVHRPVTIQFTSSVRSNSHRRVQPAGPPAISYQIWESRLSSWELCRMEDSLKSCLPKNDNA